MAQIFSHTIPPGVRRTMGVSETPGYVDPQAAQLDAEVEQLRQERREAAKVEYAGKIRQGEISVEDRERFNREFGLTGARIISDREALGQEARLLNVLAEADPDFAAMEKAVTETDDAARTALLASLVDNFHGLPLEQLAEEIRTMRESIPRLRYQNPNLPDRHVGERLASAADAKSALRYAHEKKPSAERELSRLKQANAVLWPGLS